MQFNANGYTFYGRYKTPIRVPCIPLTGDCFFAAREINNGIAIMLGSLPNQQAEVYHSATDYYYRRKFALSVENSLRPWLVSELSTVVAAIRDYFKVGVEVTSIELEISSSDGHKAFFKAGTVKPGHVEVKIQDGTQNPRAEAEIYFYTEDQISKTNWEDLMQQSKTVFMRKEPATTEDDGWRRDFTSGDTSLLVKSYSFESDALNKDLLSLLIAVMETRVQYGKNKYCAFSATIRSLIFSDSASIELKPEPVIGGNMTPGSNAPMMGLGHLKNDTVDVVS